MIDNRRAQLIAEVVKHLEDLDGNDLKDQMGSMKDPMKDDPMSSMGGDMSAKMPMEGSPEEEASESPEEEKKEDGMLGEKSAGMGPEGDEGDDIDDEDLEELGRMS